jgi:aldose 1-epimerase
MFKINHVKTEGSNYIELKNLESNSSAKIFLDLGGSLQELNLGNNTIIKNLYPLNYKDTYASAILFPFVSRIKDGTYSFEDKKYNLKINEKEKNNAIHGLIFNKHFEVLEQNTSKAKASIKLQFKVVENPQGFSFKFTIQLVYSLTKSSLSLKVIIKNIDTKSFPFSIGWHPYFYSSDLYNSFLNFKSTTKIVFDKKMIPTDYKKIDLVNEIQLKNKKLDNCYTLENNQVFFKTPNYSISINSTSKEKYLQIYTPNKLNTLAIEPATAPANSFNNLKGLQILKPNNEYEITWKIELIRKKL